MLVESLRVLSGPRNPRALLLVTDGDLRIVDVLAAGLRVRSALRAVRPPA